jgi:hypothetical protein
MVNSDTDLAELTHNLSKKLLFVVGRGGGENLKNEESDTVLTGRLYRGMIHT